MGTQVPVFFGKDHAPSEKDNHGLFCVALLPDKATPGIQPQAGLLRQEFFKRYREIFPMENIRNLQSSNGSFSGNITVGWDLTKNRSPSDNEAGACCRQALVCLKEKNIMQPLLPYGKYRSLTPMEAMLVRKVFGTSIHPVQVKIHHGKYIGGIQPDYAAMTPYGEIYFPTPLYTDDYSSNGLLPRQQHLFIHEMVHVWQYRLGYPVMAKGLVESVIGSITGYGYNYDLKKNTKLSDYPMEAQANIIADYAMYVIFNSPKHYSRKNYGKLAYSLTDLQAVLTDFINTPSSRGNLPKETKSGYCKMEPNIANCMTR